MSIIWELNNKKTTFQKEWQWLHIIISMSTANKNKPPSSLAPFKDNKFVLHDRPMKSMPTEKSVVSTTLTNNRRHNFL